MECHDICLSILACYDPSSCRICGLGSREVGSSVRCSAQLGIGSLDWSRAAKEAMSRVRTATPPFQLQRHLPCWQCPQCLLRQNNFKQLQTANCRKMSKVNCWVCHTSLQTRLNSQMHWIFISDHSTLELEMLSDTYDGHNTKERARGRSPVQT